MTSDNLTEVVIAINFLTREVFCLCLYLKLDLEMSNFCNITT